MSQRKVVCAALLLNPQEPEESSSRPPAPFSNFIVCGVRHYDLIMHHQLKYYTSLYSTNEVVQGFVDQYGVFLTRKRRIWWLRKPTRLSDELVGMKEGYLVKTCTKKQMRKAFAEELVGEFLSNWYFYKSFINVFEEDAVKALRGSGVKKKHIRKAYRKLQ